ncbi:MAG: hypothetical protein AB1772_03330 [Candidatus Zixiibacteriota bacterium]
MNRTSIIMLIIAGAVILAAVTTQLGCSEKEVPFIIDEDEIARYLSEVSIARELFRTTGLINSTPYTLPFDSAVITDVVLSRKRSLDISLVPLKIAQPGGDSVPNYPDTIYVDHGYLGRLRESLVEVNDRFTIEVTKAYSTDTVVDTVQLDLTRYAFFLKLGDDTRPYVGWILWGFSGIGSTPTPLSVVVKGSDGADFRGDLGLYADEPLSSIRYIPKVPYIRLTAMDTVDQGSRLLITTTKTSTGLPTNPVISDYEEGGTFARAMVRYDPANYVDSLSYQTPTNNPRLYNQFMIQMFTEAAFPHRTAFVVPYRSE